MVGNDSKQPERAMNDGTKGAAFRIYKRDFSNEARGQFARDDLHSFWTTYKRNDEGGTGPNAAALPAQSGGSGGGVNQAYTAAVKKKAVRNGRAFVYLVESTDNEGLKQMLADLAATDPAELAADAWDLILRECDDPSDDLELSTMNLQWSSLTIMNTVGHKLETITDYARTLNNANARRPHASQFSEDDKAIKFLSSIKFPESLAKDAMKELRATGARREFKKGAKWVYDLKMNGYTVEEFKARWVGCGYSQVEGCLLYTSPSPRDS